jgi:predicted transcriptional regulator
MLKVRTTENGPMASDVKPVRFQVPVPEDVAMAIDTLAERLDRPSSWLAIELIKESIEDRKRFCEWFGLTFLGTAYDVIKQVTGRRPRKLSEQKEIRLQLTAPTELVAEISRLAEQWQQTPVKTAAMLLVAGVHHHKPYIEAVTSRLVKAALGKGRPNRSKAQEA